MMRTRNLAVVTTFVTAGALGAAVALFDTSLFGTNQLAALGLAVSDEERSFLASLPEVESTFAYDDRVRELKKKIANSSLGEYEVEAGELVDSATSTESTTTDSDSETGDEVALRQERRCSLYQVSNTPWDAREVKMQVSEGARLFYRAGAEASVGSTTTATKEILAQLPLRNAGSGAYCIPSDVIGITENGYLIYNKDVSLFASYGGQTLIGYALDGLPIYGASEVKTDECGGAVVGGKYRYVLNSAQETVITCYAATPIKL